MVKVTYEKELKTVVTGNLEWGLLNRAVLAYAMERLGQAKFALKMIKNGCTFYDKTDVLKAMSEYRIAMEMWRAL